MRVLCMRLCLDMRITVAVCYGPGRVVVCDIMENEESCDTCILYRFTVEGSVTRTGYAYR